MRHLLLSDDTALAVSLLLVGAAVLLFAISRRSRALRSVLVLLSIAVTVRYLVWRCTGTLNTSSWIGTLVSVTVFAAEIYGFGAVLFFYFQVQDWRSRPVRVAPPRTRTPTVDVFVTIVNEPLDILHRTLVGCLSMAYPEDRRTIYVLDDGHRDEVRQLAARLGCRYIARPDRRNAKAGNLNHALAHSSGELVVNFDADHVPVATFLDECVGFFEDPGTAFVQTPHHFYNPDPYQRNLKLEREIIHEQDLFFLTMQPGRDLANSAFFCGSGAIFRRSVLEEIGGFILTSVTEDIHTSILIHARGHRSVYLARRLSAGLSPESFSSYLRQRQRWARGHVQILLSRENPLVRPRLTLAQRLNYFASIYYFLHGLPRVIYLVGPLFYLLFLVPPLIADFRTLLSFYLAHYAITLLAFNRTVGKMRSPFWSDVYETVMSFHLGATALASLLTPRRREFDVTPKGERFAKSTLDVPHSLPHWITGALLVAGLVHGAFIYLGSGGQLGAFWISVAWSAYNLLLVATAIGTARDLVQRRGAPRLRREFACEIETSPGTVIAATTQDLGEAGVSVVLREVVPLPADVRVRVRSAIGATRFLNGRVVRYESRDDGAPYVAVAFHGLTEDDRQDLIRQVFCNADAWEPPPPQSLARGLRSLQLMATAWLRPVKKGLVRRRAMIRTHVELPCELMLEGSTVAGVVEDISLSGASIKTTASLPELPDSVPIRVHLDARTYAVLQSAVVRKERDGWRSVHLGIRFPQLLPEEVDLLSRKLYAH